MENLEPASTPDDAPERYRRLVKARIVFCTILCAIAATLAACSLLAPWHGTSDRNALGALSCIGIHGGCPFSDSPTTYTDHSGVHDVGIGPMVILFGLAGLATLAALTASRAVQVVTAVCATLVPLLVGPYVVFATGMAHLLVAAEPRGGAVAFYMMLFLTFVTGIVNLVDPRFRSPSQQIELPRARARVHVSGMNVAPRAAPDAETNGSPQ